MIPPTFDWGDYADKFQSDIWGLTPHFFPDCKVLDIGANRGLVTAFCAVNGGQVTAYEAHPNAYESLLQTIRDNKIEDRVTAVNKAVWTYTGTAEFDLTVPEAVHYTNSLISARSNHDYFTDPITRRRQEVQCVSFEDAVGDETWDIVKMDIEGAEFPVLLECSETILDRIKFLTVETHEYWGDERERLLNRLSKHFVLEHSFSIFATHR